MAEPIVSETWQAQHRHRLADRNVLSLPADQLHPTIRIARILRSDKLRIASRVIFDHEIVLITQGRGVCHHPNGDIPLTPGSLLFVKPFTPHAFGCLPHRSSCVEHTAIHFDLAPTCLHWQTTCPTEPPCAKQVNIFRRSGKTGDLPGKRLPAPPLRVEASCSPKLQLSGGYVLHQAII